MQISVKFIATYRKLLPEGTSGNSIQLEVADGTRLEELLASFNVPGERESVILVNGHAPADDQVLMPGDLVIAFPAMAGG